MTSQLMKDMARALPHSDCDLGDEREVIRTLRATGMSMADIIVHSDAATEHARTMRYVLNADEVGQ
ncbi:hypothetical protein [Tardiphaga sp.]|jgi:hypothetical protein|uniref:hypothetical protein n=1 Tax=Tardiphaga sp. TaxID=1926292 RepID=UPI0037D996DC